MHRHAARLMGAVLLFVAGVANGAGPKDCRSGLLPWDEVAAGIFVFRVADEEPSVANRGEVVPTAVLVARDGAAVIDPGPHARFARGVARTIRCRLGVPVRLVVNTHAHPENVLGNVAFAGKGVRIAALPEVAGLMRERCPACHARLVRELGATTMRGTRIVLPDSVLIPGQDLIFGPHRFQVMAFARAHTEIDTALWDPRSGLLFAGGLAYRLRLPEVREGSVEGWLRALAVLQDLRPGLVIGAGVGSAAETLDLTRAYLQAMRAMIRQALESGQDGARLGRLGLGGFSSLQGYAGRHPLNVQRAWRELEEAWLSHSLD